MPMKTDKIRKNRSSRKTDLKTAAGMKLRPGIFATLCSCSTGVAVCELDNELSSVLLVQLGDQKQRLVGFARGFAQSCGLLFDIEDKRHGRVG